MKNRSLLSKKLKLFYEEIKKKKKEKKRVGKMQLQADLEFKQNFLIEKGFLLSIKEQC